MAWPQGELLNLSLICNKQVLRMAQLCKLMDCFSVGLKSKYSLAMKLNIFVFENLTY
jgi:hypothetical protein